MPEINEVMPNECGPQDGGEDRELSLDQLIDMTLDGEHQKRLWLRTINSMLQSRSHDADPSGRVQLAYDLMHIAACDKARRILNSDLPPVENL